MSKQKELIGGFCPHCRYREEGNYCKKCGSRLIEIFDWDMKCKCSAIVFPWNSYCSNCGEMITIDKIIDYQEKRDKEASEQENKEGEMNKWDDFQKPFDRVNYEIDKITEALKGMELASEALSSAWQDFIDYCKAMKVNKNEAFPNKENK